VISHFVCTWFVFIRLSLQTKLLTEVPITSLLFIYYETAHLSELKVGNLKDQIARYEHKIACQQQHSNELSETLQSCRNDLLLSADTIASLSRENDVLQNSLQKTEKDLSSRIAELEHDLSVKE